MTITFDEVLKKIKSGKTVELVFRLMGSLISRHELSFEDGKIRDFSYVDSTTSYTSVKQYRKGFYGKMFDQKRVELSEERY